jgi:hypothetical protein
MAPICSGKCKQTTPARENRDACQMTPAVSVPWWAWHLQTKADRCLFKRRIFVFSANGSLGVPALLLLPLPAVHTRSAMDRLADVDPMLIARTISACCYSDFSVAVVSPFLFFTGASRCRNRRASPVLQLYIYYYGFWLTLISGLRVWVPGY